MLMKLSSLYKHHIDKASTTIVGESDHCGKGLCEKDPFETHFEQLTIPSYASTMPAVLRNLLGFEPRKR
jgi:hypothetical protein